MNFTVGDPPLRWPVGRPRTRVRQTARFSTRPMGDSGYRTRRDVTIAGGLSRLKDEFALLGAEDVLVSVALRTRNDGLPYQKAREPDDPGAACYFRLDGAGFVLACDKWDRLADNLAAIAAHVDAMRGQTRWGVGDLQQAFAGYKALAAMGAKKSWWEILGLREPPATVAETKERWLKLAAQHHPDRGGSQDQAAEINAAWREAERYYAREAAGV